MSETIVIEAVSDKFKNKFSNGSVLAGGKWMQVAKNVELSLFKKDSQIDVETKTNDKGYTTITGVSETKVLTEPKKSAKIDKETKTVNYEDNKNRRIQVQGIIQSVVQSPATINFGDDVRIIANKVLELTDLLIDGMDGRI